MTFKVGQTVKQMYQILGRLSRGSFGTVYLAFELDRERLVAIKESNTSDPEVQNALLEETKLLTQLKHQHLPLIYDYFQSNDQRFCIVTEYILGDNLENFYQKGQLPAPERAVGWMRQVLEVLTLLHTQTPPIVHRDVKLGNIQIHCVTGAAYLLDFGIAKSGLFTHTPAYTPPFAPPEQYRRGATTAATDVYAVGVCLYILLTGIEPPEGIDRDRQLLQSPRVLNPAIPHQLEQIILTALKPDPGERYGDAQAMLDAVNSIVWHEHSYETRRLYPDAAQAQMIDRYRALLRRRRKRIVALLEANTRAQQQIATTRLLLARRRTALIRSLRQMRTLSRQIWQAEHERTANLLLVLWHNRYFRGIGTILVCVGIALLFLMPKDWIGWGFQGISLLCGSYPLIGLAILSLISIKRYGWAFGPTSIVWFVACITYALFISIVSASIADALARSAQSHALSFLTAVQIMVIQGVATGILAAGFRRNQAFDDSVAGHMR